MHSELTYWLKLELELELELEFKKKRSFIMEGKVKEVVKKNDTIIDLLKIALPLIIIMVGITYGTYFLLLGY